MLTFGWAPSTNVTADLEHRGSEWTGYLELPALQPQRELLQLGGDALLVGHVRRDGDEGRFATDVDEVRGHVEGARRQRPWRRAVHAHGRCRALQGGRRDAGEGPCDCRSIAADVDGTGHVCRWTLRGKGRT